MILDAATAVIRQNRNRKDKRLWTDREGGSRIIYYRGNDELEEADFIVRTLKQARAEDVDATMAVLYRTNAQSRAIEDSLMRESVPYKIIGGVRFYERKEIKDSLAYLKLIINPHDDVSLRRVINVPARGVGKGVMDGLQAIDPEAIDADAPPLLAIGLQEAISARSLWAQLVYAVEEGKLAPRAVASLRAFRDLHRQPCARRAPGSGVGRSRQDAGSDRLPQVASRGEHRGSQRADREPDGTRVGGEGLREPGSPKRPSAASSIGCRSSRRRTRSRATAKRASG